MATPSTLEQLYHRLRGHNGLETLKQKLEEWEYDIECIQNDINDDEEPDIKEVIPSPLFTTITSVMNGQLSPSNAINIHDSPKLSKLYNNITSIISNKNAVNMIIGKCKDEEVNQFASKLFVSSLVKFLLV